MPWTRTTTEVSQYDGTNEDGTSRTKRVRVHAWQDDAASPLLMTSFVNAEDPPPTMTSGLMLTHRSSGLGVLGVSVNATYLRRVLPKMLGLPLPWDSDHDTIGTAVMALTDDHQAILTTICAGKDPEPERRTYVLPVGVFSLIAARTLLLAYHSDQRVQVLDEIRFVHQPSGYEHPVGANVVRARQYLALCPGDAQVTGTVERGRYLLHVAFSNGRGGATFEFHLHLDPATERAAVAFVAERLAAQVGPPPTQKPMLRSVPRPTEEEPSPPAAPRPRPPRPVMVQDGAPGMNSSVALSSGIPNPAGWVQDGHTLTFHDYLVGPLSMSGHTPGWCWYMTTDPSPHLARSGAPFRRAADAIYSVQLAQRHERAQTG